MECVKYLSTFVSVFVFLSISSCSRLEDAGHPIFGKTVTAGREVTVDLTPQKYSDGFLDVDIRVTTHTINDLDRYDLKQITLLRAPGIELGPVSAPHLQGHHNRGQLEFKLLELPSAFQIDIRGLPGSDLMTFKWP